MKITMVYALIVGALLHAVPAGAQSPYQSSSDFAKYARQLRENSILKLEPVVLIPTDATRHGVGGKYPWKLNIITTTFWVGEQAGQNNPVHNFSSSWDKEWYSTFGGFDNPRREARRTLPEGGSIPANFIPQGNPFYIALPYNDVTRGDHKPEAALCIPWFKQVFEKRGQSVCKDRWLAVRKGGKVAYAQWSDCGPFRTDHWQYVFGSERPAWNLNKGAGLDVSPAVRDYLGMADTDVVDWKFVEFKDVPIGPWSRFGENNQFVHQARKNGGQLVRNETKKSASNEPVVLTK